MTVVFFQMRLIQPDCLDPIHVFGIQRSVNTLKFVLKTELIKSGLSRLEDGISLGFWETTHLPLP